MFFIHGGRGEYVFIQMENGRIVAELSCEEGQYVFRTIHNSSVENVCDGEWHNVEVFLNLQVLVMRVDRGGYYVSDEKSDVNVFIEATENPCSAVLNRVPTPKNSLKRWIWAVLQEVR